MRSIALTTLAIFLIQNIWSQNSLATIYNNNDRPSRENIRIQVADDQGNKGYLPVSVIKGSKSGPTFTIIAGVHGFEYPPIVATQELMREIDFNKLSGTIIFVPIANRGSFYTRTPFINPQDKVNLNNAFPGNSKGSITQRLAREITEKIIPISDVFLDIHGGDACEDLIPFVCYYNNENKPEQTAKAKRLSDTSGFSHVVSYPYTLLDTDPAKYVFKQAVQDGKVALSIESGKLGNVHEEEVSLIKKGVYHMLAEMKMYDKTVESSPAPIQLNDQTYVRSEGDGIFYSDYKAGDSVEVGDVVGYTTDEFGIVMTEYKAPVSGIILYMLATPPINKGDTVMCISRYLEKNK